MLSHCFSKSALSCAMFCRIIDTDRAMVRDASRSVVDSKDVLSDKVFMYDRESNRLFEPKTPERSASERGER